VNRSRLLALAAAALFSTGGTIIKYCSFAPLEVACFRCAFAVVALAAFVPGTRRVPTGRILVVAAAYAMQSIPFAAANKLTTAANAIFLQDTAPLYVLLLSPLLLQEKVRARDFAYLAALAAGMTMFFVGTEAASVTATDPILGNVLAAVSGVGWALTVLGLRWLGRDDGGAALTATLWGNLLACLVALPWALPVPAGSPRDWALVAFLGVVQIGLAYSCLTRAATGLPALEMSLLLLLEPVLSAVWAWVFQHERPGPWSLAGCATILAATVVHALRRGPATGSSDAGRAGSSS
jgi:drug/metabolite transporter (DMT)-like permease